MARAKDGEDGEENTFATAAEVDGLRKTLDLFMKRQEEHNHTMQLNFEQVIGYLNRVAGQPGALTPSDKGSRVLGNDSTPTPEKNPTQPIPRCGSPGGVHGLEEVQHGLPGIGTDGFSVHDAAGNLAFRVDNYSRRRKFFAGELLLMDGHGAPLLALRPQILSMHDQWNCYRASEEASDKRSTRRQQLFSMRKCSLAQSTDEAEVYMVGSGCTTTSSDHNAKQAPSFRVQGSFWRRSCKIRNGDGEEVARITRKKAGAATLGEDVFSLTVMPNADCTMIMAFVVVMDRICQRPDKPLMCSS